MKEACSQRKIEANRRNAQKSTGPRTTAGKVQARLNAITHGILAKEAVVMDGDGVENAADFAQLVTDLHAQLRPQDAVEHVLVDRIAACYWRLRRAQRYEVGAVREGLDDCRSTSAEPGPNVKEHYAGVRKLEMALAIEKHLDQEPAERRQALGAQSPEVALNASTDELDHRPSDGSDPSVKEPPAQESEDRFAKMEEAIREYKGLTEQAEKQDALAESRRPLLAALPSDEQLNRLIRYESMLDRQLHRALSELRRRRSWNPLQPPEDADTNPANGQ